MLPIIVFIFISCILFVSILKVQEYFHLEESMATFGLNFSTSSPCFAGLPHVASFPPHLLHQPHQPLLLTLSLILLTTKAPSLGNWSHQEWNQDRRGGKANTSKQWPFIYGSRAHSAHPLKERTVSFLFTPQGQAPRTTSHKQKVSMIIHGRMGYTAQGSRDWREREA